MPIPGLRWVLLAGPMALLIGGCLGSERDVTRQMSPWPEPFVPGTKIQLEEDVFLYRDGVVSRIGATPYDGNVTPSPPSMPRTVEDYESGKDDGGEIIGVVRSGTKVAVQKVVEVTAINLRQLWVYGTVLDGGLGGRKIVCGFITTGGKREAISCCFDFKVVEEPQSE